MSIHDYEPGWYYLHYRNTSDLEFLQNDLKIDIDSSSFINNYWLSVFLNAIELNRVLQHNFFISKFTQSDVSNAPLLDSDSHYFLQVHKSFKNTHNYTHVYSNFYVSNEFPDLNDPTIFSVTPITGPELLNRWAVGLVQGNDIKLEYHGNRLITNRPIHDRGIRGEGVVIGMLDSGIDTHLCQFRDPNRQVPFNRVDFQHRKIVRYETLADSGDPPRGHGTHVAGILAGDAICDDCAISMYNGHAPHAKIFMADAGYMKTPLQLIPDLRLRYVVDLAKRLNVSVMSNSWGFPPGGKEGYRTMFDRIAHENRDISFFFGAGNSRKMFDCYTPGNSKNTFAVGGVSNLDVYEKVEKSRKPPLVLLVNDQKIPLSQETWALSIMTALKTDPIPNFRNRKINKEFVLVSPKCGELEKLPNTTVAVFMTSGGLRCQFSKFPVFVFDKAYLSKFQKATTASIVIDFKPSASEWKVSKFNSGGPSDQGILKPDIMAPGTEIYSTAAGRNQNCSCENGLFKKSGTSMAVPAVSGAAALLVQYFTSGFFPVSLSPTSMLIRSVLVNGALPRKSEANLASGFGMIRLENSMAFNDSSFKLLVANNQMIKHGTEMVASIELVSPGTLVVVMTYSDPPVSSKSYMPLYADLDLIVVTPTGESIYNNECRQTTERIVIENAQPGRYLVRITYHVYFDKVPIPFAVSATGPFNQSGLLEFTPKEKPVQLCLGLKTGHLCEIPVINASKGLKFSAQGRKMNYFVVTIPPLKPDEDLELSIHVQAWKSTLMQVEVSMNQVPKFGGDLLFWNQVTSSHSYKMNNTTHPEFAPGKSLYISIIETTARSRDVTIGVKIIRQKSFRTSVVPRPTRPATPFPQTNTPTLSEHQKGTTKLRTKTYVVASVACVAIILCIIYRAISAKRTNVRGIEDMNAINQLHVIPQETRTSIIEAAIEKIENVLSQSYTQEHSPNDSLGVDRISDEFESSPTPL